MPYSEKATRFFQGIAHGMKPRTKTDLTPEKAHELLSHEKKKVEARVKGQKRAMEKL